MISSNTIHHKRNDNRQNNATNDRDMQRKKEIKSQQDGHKNNQLLEIGHLGSQNLSILMSRLGDAT